MDNDDDGSPSQSISNFNRVATSSSCSSSLLVSAFVVVLLLPKRPAQAHVPPRFRVGVVVMNWPSGKVLATTTPMSITGIDIVAIAVLPTAVAAAPAVVATIERRAEEDLVRQAEEGVVHAAPGVGAVASVVLLLLRRRRRRC
jgi:hypothetical protein